MSLGAQIAKTEKKKKPDWSFDCILSVRKEQTFSPNWQGFKVFPEMWDNIVGCKYIYYFLYPGGNVSRAARWDIAYLEQCVYDLCSNGILIDTVGADSILCLLSDDASNKQKQSKTRLLFSTKCPFSFTSLLTIINVSPISWAHSLALLIVASKPKVSDAN